MISNHKTLEITKKLNQILELGINNPEIKFLISNGQIYEKIAKDSETKRFSKILKPQPKACFRNALLTSLFNPELKYVEGYYLFEGIPFPIEHAWNLNIHGEIIDTTVVAFMPDDRPIEYFGCIIPEEILNQYKLTDMRSNLILFYLNQTNETISTN